MRTISSSWNVRIEHTKRGRSTIKVDEKYYLVTEERFSNISLAEYFEGLRIFRRINLIVSHFMPGISMEIRI